MNNNNIHKGEKENEQRKRSGDPPEKNTTGHLNNQMQTDKADSRVTPHCVELERKNCDRLEKVLKKLGDEIGEFEEVETRKRSRETLIKEKENEVEQLKQQQERLEQQMEQLKKQKRDVEQQIEQKENELNEMKSEFNGIKLNFEQMETKHQQNKYRFDRLKELYNEMNQILDECDSEENEEEIESLNQSNQMETEETNEIREACKRKDEINEIQQPNGNELQMLMDIENEIPRMKETGNDERTKPDEQKEEKQKKLPDWPVPQYFGTNKEKKITVKDPRLGTVEEESTETEENTNIPIIPMDYISNNIQRKLDPNTRDVHVEYKPPENEEEFTEWEKIFNHIQNTHHEMKTYKRNKTRTFKFSERKRGHYVHVQFGEIFAVYKLTSDTERLLFETLFGWHEFEAVDEVILAHQNEMRNEKERIENNESISEDETELPEEPHEKRKPAYQQMLELRGERSETVKERQTKIRVI